jgi:hypothetical protein
LSLYETRLRSGGEIGLPRGDDRVSKWADAPWTSGTLPYYDASKSIHLLREEVDSYRIALKDHRDAGKTRMNYERMLIRQREMNRDLATCHFSKSLNARFERINALMAELGRYFATAEAGGK